MTLLLLLAIVIVILEIRTLNKHFQTPIETQNEEKEEILSYIDQMRDYYGTKTFIYITLVSSLMINLIYIIYFFVSAKTVDYEVYQIICGFFIIDRVFKFTDAFDINYEEIDYVVGSDIVIGFRSILMILHVFVTVSITIFNL